MYAVIRAGGKQYKVAKGDVIEIERVSGDRKTVEFVPLLVVDDKGKTRSGKADLADVRVVAKILGESKGDKVDISTYRSKTRTRRHMGHRQKYTSVQIDDIKLTAGRKSTTKASEKEKEENDGS
jgi:large subunit ribosomal protein L21